MATISSYWGGTHRGIVRVKMRSKQRCGAQRACGRDIEHKCKAVGSWRTLSIASPTCRTNITAILCCWSGVQCISIDMITGSRQVTNEASAIALATSPNGSTEQNVWPWVTIGPRFPFQQSASSSRQPCNGTRGSFAKARVRVNVVLPGVEECVEGVRGPHLQQLATIRFVRAEPGQLVADDVCRTGIRTPIVGFKGSESNSHGSSPGS
eukprot:3345794-Prymnesium_polylepis.1